MDVSRARLFFRGEVGWNLGLGVRGGETRTLRNEAGRYAIRGGAAFGLVAVAPGH